MIWADRGSNAAPVSSLAQTVGDPPYSVADLGDGTAMLHHDTGASWSTILCILKVLYASGIIGPKALARAQKGACYTNAEPA